MTTVFFSWQTDTPPKGGRHFLKSVLEEVCEQLAPGSNVAEVVRDVGVNSAQAFAGRPPMLETLFKKLEGTGVFLADMTFTAKRPDGRPLPNSNVLIEYGCALRSLPYTRVLCVMNDAYGEPTQGSLSSDWSYIGPPYGIHSARVRTPPKKKELTRSSSQTLLRLSGTLSDFR